MQFQDVLYYGFWAGLFFLMMRFGCGHHIMGHSHHRHNTAPAAPGTPTGRPGDPPRSWLLGKEHK